MESLRAARTLIAFGVMIILSIYMYWQRETRAVTEPTLCRDLEKHVVAMCKGANGAIRDEELGRAENIRDLCEMRLSTNQARCMLKATSLVAVDACVH